MISYNKNSRDCSYSMEGAHVTVIKETEGKTSPLISQVAFFRRERKTFAEALCINQHGLTVTANTSKIPKFQNEGLFFLLMTIV